MQSVSIAAAHWLRQQQEVFQISTGDIVGLVFLGLFFIFQRYFDFYVSYDHEFFTVA